MMFLGSIFAGRCSDATIRACAMTFPFNGQKNPNHETPPEPRVSGAHPSWPAIRPRHQYGPPGDGMAPESHTAGLMRQ